MAVEKINTEQLLAAAGKYPVIDVRSPAEFEQAHIPGAVSLPLFSNEERKIVGTSYKQQSKDNNKNYSNFSYFVLRTKIL